jgi:hypothetical protein
VQMANELVPIAFEHVDHPQRFAVVPERLV